MPIKPPRPRKPSTVPKDAAKVTKDSNDGVVKPAPKDSGAMLPPPDPLPLPGILEPEAAALSGCLKNAVVKTGQIYGFYADTRKLGIQKYAPSPPRSLTSALGREVEKYDQLCDAIESHLLRAIAVLQRDANREERRIKAAADAVATRTRSKSTSRSPTTTRIPLPPVPDATDVAAPPQTSPPVSESGSSRSRRPSAISLSSLHRPSFPHKLDLSSSSLRISVEEASLFNSGLASPVTLAPKSARTTGSELPDLMAAFASSADAASRPVDLDLTVPDTDHATSQGDLNIDMDLGNSAEKPIELDLEGMDIDMANMTELFGDAASTHSNDARVDGLFSPSPAGPSLGVTAGEKPVKQENMDMDILSAFGHGDEDLFASLDVPSENVPTGSATQSPALTLPSSTLGQPSGATPGAPSPGTILASFASSSQIGAADPMSAPQNIALSNSDSSFDLASLDLSNLSPAFFNSHAGSGMNFTEMEELLSMGGELGSNPDGKS